MEVLFHPIVGGIVLGNLLIAVGSACVGTFALLRREAMVGDVLAHATIPGIGIAYALLHRAELSVLLWGAVLSVAAALLALDALRRQEREDTQLGIILSVAFGAGIVLLTALQRGNGVQQAGIWRVLFGQAAALTWSDVGLIAGVVALVSAFVAVAFKELVALAFDAEFLRTLPLPLRWVELGYRGAVAAMVIVGVYSVGALLMGAFLVLPPMAARLFVRRVGAMVVGAALVAAGAVMGGVVFSVAFPRVATGPAIVTVAALSVVCSHVCAPHRGMLARIWQWLRERVRRWDEDAHKVLYRIAERCTGGCWEGWPLWRLLVEEGSWIRAAAVVVWLYSVRSISWRRSQGWSVTPKGQERARRVIRRHRLWELYLERVIGVAPERVHAEAELIEHVLTPELEERLEAMLEYPRSDPHGRPIPPGQL